MKTAAIIPAGGSGKRMQGSLSKQYLLLNGIPVLVHTLKVFQRSPMVHDIFLVVPPGDIELVKQTIIQKHGISKVRQVLPGGKERQNSVKNGLDAVGDEYDIVVIHDGVRPFISEELLHLAILEASREAAVTLGVPVKDTVKVVGQDGEIMETVSRDHLWLTQTPQAFKREVIIKAYRLAFMDHYTGTDDAGLVERIGVPVKMVHGSYENIKITTKDDLLLAERFMKNR
jgi:2-C-methyl-D-erythritol 4-phosphate cytidylyltransferase